MPAKGAFPPALEGFHPVGVGPLACRVEVANPSRARAPAAQAGGRALSQGVAGGGPPQGARPCAREGIGGYGRTGKGIQTSCLVPRPDDRCARPFGPRPREGFSPRSTSPAGLDWPSGQGRAARPVLPHLPLPLPGALGGQAWRREPDVEWRHQGADWHQEQHGDDDYARLWPRHLAASAG